MELHTKILLETLEILLDDYRHRINAAYGRRDGSSDPIDIAHYQREVDRLLASIKMLESLIQEGK